MKINWNLMRDIIRVDLITMRGGKNNTLLTLILFWGAVLVGFSVGVRSAGQDLMRQLEAYVIEES